VKMRTKAIAKAVPLRPMALLVDTCFPAAALQNF
jgi:hypothetical protein